MSVFEDVTLHWDGEEYTIPANRVMRLIQAVEDVVTLPELQDCIVRMKAGRVAAAYGVMLRFAGVQVTDEEVYAGIFESQEQMQEILTEAGAILYRLICPPQSLNAKKKTTKKKSKKKRKAS